MKELNQGLSQNIALGAAAPVGVDGEGVVIDGSGCHVIVSDLAVKASGLQVNIGRRVIDGDFQIRIQFQTSPGSGAQSLGPLVEFFDPRFDGADHRIPHHLLALALQGTPELIMGVLSHLLTHFVLVGRFSIIFLLESRLDSFFVDGTKTGSDLAGQVGSKRGHEVLQGGLIVVKVLQHFMGM